MLYLISLFSLNYVISLSKENFCICRGLEQNIACSKSKQVKRLLQMSFYQDSAYIFVHSENLCLYCKWWLGSLRSNNEILAENFISPIKKIAVRNSVHTMDHLVYSPAKLNIIRVRTRKTILRCLQNTERGCKCVDEKM